MKKSKWIRLISIFVIGIFLITGCGNSKENSEVVQTDQTQESAESAKTAEEENSDSTEGKNSIEDEPSTGQENSENKADSEKTTGAENTIDLESIEDLETTEETAASAKKPRIGLAWKMDVDLAAIPAGIQVYMDAVTQAGGEPVYLSQVGSVEEAEAILDTVEGLVFMGGKDIDASYYQEENLPVQENIDATKDLSDICYMEAALTKDIPTLAICRGCQILNVVSGGSLYQDIPSQMTADTTVVHRDPAKEDWVYHDISLPENTLLSEIMGNETTLNVDSWHHQGIKDLGDHLEVLATSADGLVEAIQRTDKTWFVGVQFHPEAMLAEGKTEYLQLYQDFVNQMK